jgi:hypothetical protein
MKNAWFIDKEPNTKLNKNFPLELHTKTYGLLTIHRKGKKNYPEAYGRIFAKKDINKVYT